MSVSPVEYLRHILDETHFLYKPRFEVLKRIS